MTDLLVIGGGAAGLMAAGAACARGLTVTVLEHNPKGPGQKLLITGKGRCNVTSDSDVREFLPYVRHNGRFLYSSLYAFPPSAAMELFESLGGELKAERGRRVFPRSDRAADVLAALRDYARDAEFVRGSAKKLVIEDGVCKGAVTDRGETLRAENTLIATGGISYPATGSDGSGVKLAKALGHAIVPLAPSLVPLESDSPYIADLQGLSLRNIEGTVYADGKKIGSEFGEMLFTHFGVSGPIILSLSKCVAEAFARGAQEVELAIDLKPALDKDKLDARLQRDFTQYSRKQMPNGMKDLLPQRLIAPVLDQAFIDEEKFVNQLSRAERRRLVDVLKAFTVPVTGTRPIAEAIVTAGGVSLKEIDPKTMESKLIKGLFFAGEVMDIDGYTGGYNLQAAFSTGYAAGTFAAQI